MNGAEQLSYAEIEAWSRMRGIALSPWEVQTIRAMDRAVHSEIIEITRPQNGSG